MGRNPLLRKALAVGIILVFIAVNILSVSASIVPADFPSMKSPTPMINLDTTYIEKKNGNDIVWDNYPPIYGWGYSSQYDMAYPWQSQVADDIIFETNIQVTGVHWWGIFFEKYTPWPNPCDFNIIFYGDDGTGNMPTGAGMDDPTSTAIAFYFIPDVLGNLFAIDSFEYNATLPQSFNTTANTKYWIAIQAKVDWPPQWGWYTNGNNPDQLHGPVQGFPLMGHPYWTDLTDGDMAFQLYGGPYIPPSPPKPNLKCTGELSWDDIKPGTTVNGSFQVMNIGEPDSYLNWTIGSCPDWGTWTFTPSSGINLKPDHGAVTVNVEATTPEIKNEEFEGQVKVVNTDNSSDFCIIPVTLTTPLNHDMFYYHYFERLFEQYPHAFPILRYLLEWKSMKV